MLLVLLAGAAAALADTWSSQTSGTTQQLNSLRCTSSSNCIAVGNNGTLVATTNGGSSWSSQTSGLTSGLESISCPSSSDCVAVGVSGHIIATTSGGSSWSAQTSGVSVAMYGVSCTSTSDCWAVGASGTILVTTNGGSSWSAQTSGVTSTLQSVWCASSSDCWAVGASGKILVTTNGGSSWSSQTSGVTGTLYGVACNSTSACLAVGASGKILTTANGGSSWSSQTSGTSNQLNAISCASSSACWAVGASGTILATANSGSSWVSQTSGTTNQLMGAYCLSGACWAVGVSGTIVGAKAPANTAAPSITGTVSQGQVLTAGAGTWTGSATISYAYQWQDCTSAAETSCSNISGATSSTYTLQSSDVGSFVAVKVTGSNTEGSATAMSASAQVASSTSYRGAVQAAGPVAFWPLDDSSLSTAFDVSENGNNGTYASGVTTGMLDQTGPTGSGGGSLSLDGSAGAYVLFPGSLLPSSSTADTVEMWFKTSSTNGILMGSEYSLGPSQPSAWDPMLYVDSSGYLQSELWYDGALNTIISTAPVDDGHWHEAVVTVTTGGTETLMVDGNAEATGTLSSSPSPGYATIGAGSSQGDPSGNNGWETFNGQIADVSIYRTALSQATVDAQYEEAVGNTPTNTASPAITGTPNIGDVLTASSGSWSGSIPITYTYQWQDCTTAADTSCSNISGATSSTYTVQSADAGSFVAVKVTGTNSNGSASALSASALVASASSYVSAVQAAGPLAFWPLDDSSLSTAFDVSGNGKNATYAAGVTTGMLDQAGFPGGSGLGSLSLNGSASAYVLFPGSLLPGSSTADTVEMWFKTTATNGVLMGSEYSLGPSQPSAWDPMLYVDSSGYLQAELWWDGSSNTIVSTNPVDDGNWHEAVVTVTTGGTETLTVDGTQDATGTLSSSPTPGYATIGAGSTQSFPNGANGWATFNGQIADVSIYNTALSSSTIGAQYADAAQIAPTNTSPPSVTGTDTQGQVLTASTGAWSGSTPMTYSYQWQDCDSSGSSCVNISGATGSTYTLTSSDVGDTIAVAVTASNTAGSATTSSAATAVVHGVAPSNTTLPAITGTATDGQTLTAGPGSWTGTPTITYSYQWKDCTSTAETSCSNISSATASTYTAHGSDVGSYVAVTVTATNTSGSTSATSATTTIVDAVPPSNTTLPAITGTATEGQTLTASNGAWSGSTPITYTYQWKDCNTSGSSCVNITGATTSTYALTSSDVSDTIVVAVTASNTSLPGGGSSAASSVATGVVQGVPPSNTTLPAVTGTTTAGHTLTASTGSWTGTTPISYSYQWESCDPTGANCTDISGATSSSYSLSSNDVGSTVVVAVTATNSQASQSASSTTTSLIEPSTGSCGDSWIPSGADAWETASNWSTGAAPTSSQTVCLRSGSAPTVNSTDSADSIQGAGATLTINSGELDLTNTSASSEIGTTNVGGGTLNDSGSLTVDNDLEWTGGTITGSGTIALATTAASTITPTTMYASPELDGITITNNGTLSVNCASPTDDLGAAELDGADGASISNNGTMDLGNTPGQLCAFAQESGTASQLTNSGTLSVPQSSSPGVGSAALVGWQFSNTSTGSVLFGSGGPGGADLVLTGGQGPGGENGTWDGDALYALSGSYTFATGATVNIGGLDVGTSSSDGDPYDAFLGGTSTPPNLTIGALSYWSADWDAEVPTGIGVESGTANIGDTSAASLINFTVTGGALSITSPSSDPTELQNCSYLYGGTVTLYGATDIEHCGDDFTIGNGLTAATLINDGTLTQSSNDSALAISPGATVNQNGTLILQSDNSVYGRNGGGLLDGSGTTIVEDPSWANSSNTNEGWTTYYGSAATCGATIGYGRLTIKQQTIDNEASLCGLSMDGGRLGRGATVINQGFMTGGIQHGSGGRTIGFSGSAGAVIDNEGVFDSDGADYTASPGGAPPQFVNTGSMIDDNPNLNTGWTVTPNNVAWVVSGAGTIQSDAYIIDPNASNWYGGSNPAAPHQTPGNCDSGVVCATGDQTERETDMSFSGLGGLSLTRTYNSQLGASQSSPGMFGYGWTSAFEAHLYVDTADGVAYVQQTNGSTAGFTINTDGSFTPDEGIEATLALVSGGDYDYTLPDQTTYAFNSAGVLISETSRIGVVTAFSYNGQGQLTSVTAPSGRAFTFTYNTNGLVATATDPAGFVVSYAYDYNDDLASVTDSAGPATTRWQFGYDGFRQLTSVTDADGNTTHISYAAGRVGSRLDSRTHTESWSYAQNETVQTSAAGNVTDELFNSEDEPVSETDADGTSAATTTTNVYNAAGEPTSVTDGNTQTSTYGYDAAGNQTSEATPDEQTTSSTYDSARDVTSTTQPGGEETSYVYNSQGLPTSTTKTGPGGLSEATTSTYNSDGELTSETDARGKTTSYTYDAYGDLASETDPLGNETTYGYDADGRQTSMVLPAGNVAGGDPSAYTTAYVFDALGDLTSVTSPVGDITSYTYDGDQNKLTQTDPDGNTTSYTYDPAGELTTTTLPDGTTETSTYDSDGNAITQTNGNSDTTTYTYNALDQLASTTDPMGHTTSYVYDADGNVHTTTNPAGSVTTDGYNNEDELTSVSYSDGVTPNVTYTYNGDGLQASMTDGTGTTTYSYDGLDRLTSVTDGDGQTVSYGYNADDRVDSLGYPNGETVSETYNDDDHLSAVTDWLGNTTSFAYTPDSQLQTASYPSSTSETDTNSYNDADQLTGSTMDQGSTVLASLTYTLDSDGLITNEAQTGLPGTASTGYSYNANSELTGAGGLSYGYDDARNITELDSSGANSFSYNANSELTSSPTGTFTYNTLDERTALTPTSGTGSTYSYDQKQDLIGASTPVGDVTYAYNGDGQLANSITGGTTSQFTWDDTSNTPNLLEVNGESYIYGPDGEAIEQISASGTVQYLHDDQLGSARLITDTSGSAIGTFTYSAYGKLSASTGTAASLLGYAGQYADPATGLTYNQARWYDPASGQFMIVDPKVATTWQAYAYANDEPLQNTDPSGDNYTVPADGGYLPCTYFPAINSAVYVCSQDVGFIANLSRNTNGETWGFENKLINNISYFPKQTALRSGQSGYFGRGNSGPQFGWTAIRLLSSWRAVSSALDKAKDDTPFGNGGANGAIYWPSHMQAT